MGNDSRARTALVIAEKTKRVADDFGWAVVETETGDGLHLSFTVGMFENFGHPELAIIGLPGMSAALLLNTCGEMVRVGGGLTTNPDPFMLGELGVLLAAKPLMQSKVVEWMGVAESAYKGKVENLPALQLVWADRDNLFPWDEGASPEMRRMQRVFVE